MLDVKTLINLEELKLPTLTPQSQPKTLLAYQQSDGWPQNTLEPFFARCVVSMSTPL